MKKYLVEVKETYTHTYAVDANSKDEAETIVNLFPMGVMFLRIIAIPNIQQEKPKNLMI